MSSRPSRPRFDPVSLRAAQASVPRLLLLPLAVASACVSPGTLAEPVSFDRLLSSQQSEMVETRREVLRDPEAFAASWSKLGRFAPPPERPTLDFSRQQVILVAMGTQPCVARVSVLAVERSGRELVVRILEAPPGASCVCVVDTRPVDVVVLPRSDLPVRFEVTSGVTPCAG